MPSSWSCSGQGARLKLTLEVEASAEDGFAEPGIGVVRDNARKLKFKSESTGFEQSPQHRRDSPAARVPPIARRRRGAQFGMPAPDAPN